ncbi:MAG: transglycosylase SLT domain-containing protein [Myxococcales bacterium]|nr:transglycosylase SLT domain-containing protein [Myxococcales bacterium]
MRRSPALLIALLGACSPAPPPAAPLPDVGPMPAPEAPPMTGERCLPRPPPLDAALVASPLAGDATFGPGWRLYRRGDLPAASDALAAALEAAPDHPQAGGATLLLATIDARLRRPAAERFARAAELRPDLAVFARYRGAIAALREGHAARAAALAADVPDGLRYGYGPAKVQARALLKAARPAEAAARLARAVGRATDPAASRLRALWARAAEAAGATALAADLWRHLTLRHDDRRLQKRAKKALRALRAWLPARQRRALDQDGPREALERARGLLERHEGRAVLATLADLDTAWPAGSPDHCDVLWLRARAHTRLRDHAPAADAYAAFLSTCRDDARAVDAVFAGGRGLFTLDRHDAALAWLQDVWLRWPDHPYADDARYMAARLELQRGRPAEALNHLQALLAGHPHGDRAADAHWLLFDQRLEAVDPADGASAEIEREHRGRLTWFRGRALEAQGHPEAALDRYVEVVRQAPMGYYALLALNRLRDRAPARFEQTLEAVAAASPPTQLEPEAAWSDPDFLEGLALLRLGLGAFAWSAFDAARDRLPQPDRFTLGLARLYTLAGDAATGDRMVEREVSHIDGLAPTGELRRWFELAYPRPYRTLIDTWAEARGLPTDLVHAFTREESRFDPRARSWAGACGLMQLTEGTARDMAAAEDVRLRINCRRLFRESLNVRLGTRYLAELSARLGGHPGLVAAAYNAGPGNVDGWLEAAGDVPFDTWLENLPYQQPRQYVKRVLAAWFVYRWLSTPPEAPLGDRVPIVPLAPVTRIAQGEVPDPTLTTQAPP